MKRLLMFALTLVPAGAAFASCGSAFCMVDTTWSAQGAWTEPGVRFDLRYEYIEQDQPRAGRRKVGVGEIRQHHDEVRTVNRNWLATVDYAVSEKWGVSATLPILDRHHEHIHNHHGAQLRETWSFTEVGDLRVLARGLLRSEDAAAQRLDFYGPTLGLKLPTGKHDIRNAQGALAERTLQPGTGTTDVLFGGYFRRLLGTGASWFVDASLQKALDEREHFRPGAQVSANVGYGRQASENFAWMVQLNLLHKYRDRGAEAEPNSSGGNFVFVSPGMSWAPTHRLQVYGFVQLPLYQSVNGVQLTADWAAVAGISTRF